MAGRLTVGRDELVRYGDTTLSAVFKRQPGITVAHGEIGMRGLGVKRYELRLRGARVRLALEKML